MNIIARFKSLPVSTRRLLSIGIVLALLVGLPLFIWAIVTQRFLIIKKAASGEPGTTVPLAINETFTGPGALDPSRWNWSATVGSGVTIFNNSLKVTVPQGHDSVGGNDAVVQALVNYQIPSMVGDFTASVDLVSVDTAAGYEELKFAPNGAATVRRVKIGTTETLEGWTSVDNASSWFKNASIDLPVGTGPVKVTMTRTGAQINVYYDLGSGNQFLYYSSVGGFGDNSALPRLVVENLSPNYPSTTGYFDNYTANGDMLPVQTNTPTPTATPPPTAPPSSTPTATPTGTPPPTVRPFSILLRLEGVPDDRAAYATLGANFAKVVVKFSRQINSVVGTGYVTPPIGVDYVGNGIYALHFGIWSADLQAGSGYSITLKGEKHIATKFCQNGQTTHCTGSGGITLPDDPLTPVNLDFTGLPLQPGDIYPQDGVADTNDFNKVVGLLAKPCSTLTDQDRLIGDLDYNGCVTVKDVFLIRQTLQTRYDEN